jgi:hypothetical protein
MRDEKCVQNLSRKPEGKRPLADVTQEDNITMHLKEVCRENVITFLYLINEAPSHQDELVVTV